MGIRFYCPNGHKLNVKEFQAGRKGICPFCGAKIQIPTESTRKSSKELKAEGQSAGATPVAEQSPASPRVAVPGESATPTGAQQSVVPVMATPASAVPSTPIRPVPQPGPQPSAPAAPIGGAPQPDSQPTASAAPIVSAPAGPIVPGAGIQASPAAPQPTPSASSPVSDPLSEAGNKVWYVRPPSGDQYGPAGSDVMRSWIDEGRVSGDCLVWQEGWPDWRPAGEVFTQLRTGRPDPAPAAFEVVKTPVSAASSTATVCSRRARSRRKSKTIQATVIVVLILAVLVLSLVFAWVLTP